MKLIPQLTQQLSLSDDSARCLHKPGARAQWLCKTPQKNQVGGLCCQLIHFSTPTEFVPRRDLVNKLLKQLGDQKKFMQELKAEHAGASAEQLEQSLDQPRCPSRSIQV